MRRGPEEPRPDQCPRCSQPVLIYDWDDIDGVFLGPARVDPTPITPLDEVACTILDRPTYLLEKTIVGTHRLSRRWAITLRRHTPYAIAILPAHQCGARYPTTLADIGDVSIDELDTPPSSTPPF
ncbi:hypothetical protein C5C95_16990 [Rathayibacter sp. AY1B7]|uniref:hypothetical protein n=1 Tax=Rathayibacter sp. AY1B7 TaxID=2080532 RepID=UPI000CE93441|nr:hypothetical protein [Rathayibacter sp. AY1B7]PPH95152.1 hypothetical protein C5C95_16990 [Rathayibacter sp. AY1B7]